MPVKWTPSHVQMLFWLAWGNNKVDFKKVSEKWPDIPGEDKPTPRAISEKIQYIKKGVQEHGLAEVFVHGFAGLVRTNTKPGTRVKGEKGQNAKPASTEDTNSTALATPGSTLVSKQTKSTPAKSRKRRRDDSDLDSASLTDTSAPTTPPSITPVRASKRARKPTLKAEQSTEGDDDRGEPYQSDDEWSPERVEA